MLSHIPATLKFVSTRCTALSHICPASRIVEPAWCNLLFDYHTQRFALCAADAENLPGISNPFPQLFDPLNLLGNAASNADSANEVKRWRESEITHGRVCMLAALGIIAQEQIVGGNAPRPFPHVNGGSCLHCLTTFGSTLSSC